MISDPLAVELAGVLAGPSVGTFSAEHGARVVEVGPPGGDATRRWHLPSEDPADPRPAYFCAVNGGKESVVLDLKTAYFCAVLEVEDAFEHPEAARLVVRDGDGHAAVRTVAASPAACAAARARRPHRRRLGRPRRRGRGAVLEI